MGDSHVMWGINDHYLKDAQNISLNAEGYIYTYAKLKELLSHTTDIDAILLGFSYHNLSDYFDDYIYGSKMQEFYPRYIKVLGWKEQIKLLFKKPENLFRVGGLNIRKGIPALFTHNCEYIGSFPETKMTQILDQEHIEKRIQEQYYVKDKLCSYSEINIFYLEKIIELCEVYNIEIVFLNTPLNDEYKNKIPSKFIEAYDNVLNKYKFHTFDFENFNLPDSCFLPDGDHLNYYGSASTSIKLNELIDSFFINKTAQLRKIEKNEVFNK